MKEKTNKTATQQYEAEEAEYRAKSLIYYEHLLDSWIVSKMEYDKSLLLLSTGAIGLLLTLLTTLKHLPLISMILLALAGISFLITCITVTHTFDVNAAYVQAILFEQDNLTIRKEKELVRLKKISFWSFSGGVLGGIFSVIGHLI